jgi:lipopolysaccharide export system permease protein
MVLAIPFALVSARAGGVGLRILFGILIGMGFYNAGKLFSHMGLLNDWPALLSAGMPVVIVALAATVGLRLAERR